MRKNIEDCEADPGTNEAPNASSPLTALGGVVQFLKDSLQGLAPKGGFLNTFTDAFTGKNSTTGRDALSYAVLSGAGLRPLQFGCCSPNYQDLRM